MTCYSPLSGYRATTTNAKTGKRSIVFNTNDGFRDLPVTVACGQCIGCRLDRSAQWATRAVHELQLHERACFVTLTYADSALPPGGTLVREHLQLFMKRLRRRFPQRIRFFSCGEYGETTKRPHYHAILYGVDFTEDREPLSRSDVHTLYRSQLLDDLWSHGHCSIGTVTFDSAAYVARYTVKKITGDAAEAHYLSVDLSTGEIINRTPEFIGMSLRPAIGADWYERFACDVYPRDEVALSGRLVKPPKFYDKQLEKEDPDTLRKLKIARRRRASRRAADNTPARLATRAQVATLKLQQKKRIF